jgi:hypothetical protein
MVLMGLQTLVTVVEVAMPLVLEIRMVAMVGQE